MIFVLAHYVANAGFKKFFMNLQLIFSIAMAGL
jgi:hypothetical protein